MLKRKFMSMLLVLLCIVGICGCTANTVESKLSNKLYMCTTQIKMGKSEVTRDYLLFLNRDGRFSYAMAEPNADKHDGLWSVEGDNLILDAAGAIDARYVFKIDGNTLVYDKENSNRSLNIKDGSVFKRKGIFN